MNDFEPNDLTVRVIALSAQGNEMLSVPAGDGLRLPTVVIPRFERFAESLTTAMRRQWNCEVICLFTPASEPEEDRVHHYHVVECWQQSVTHSQPTRSVPVLSLTEESFANINDYLALRRALDECNGDGPGRELRSFAHPGWFRHLRAWVSEAITPLGFELTDGFDQLNAGPSFSLIRFETSGTPIWFKAVGEPNLQEFEVSFILAQRFPDFVAPVLARRSDCHGWLSPDLPGQNLGETLAIENWQTTAESLARLQLASLGNQSELLEAGARDLRAPVLGELLAPFFEVVARLMGKQAKFPPPALSARELCILKREIQQSLAALAALDIPDTLGSSDLNPRNIIVNAGRSSFLDWSEAYVGNPFFSFAYLLEHFRRSEPGCGEGELVDSYLVPWRSFLSSNQISSALTCVPLLAVFAFAVGSNLWRDGDFLHSPATSGYLRALTRRMNLEAKRASRSEDLCRI